VAKKPKTPPPPRRVQAPQRRADARTPQEMEARHRAILYGVAGSGILALIVVVILVIAGGGASGAKAAVTALHNAGCQYKHPAVQPRLPHYQTLNPSPPPSWNTFPPSSGRHYFQWVLWGDYTQPVPLIKEVHNLEHGGMIIQYGNKVPQGDIQQINAFYRSDPNALLVAPLPKLGDKIALTSWGQWAECTHFDENAFTKFKKAFRYHAPESSVFPKSALEPGQ
jgi:Protein of unknown function (DUF3105)